MYTIQSQIISNGQLCWTLSMLFQWSGVVTYLQHWYFGIYCMIQLDLSTWTFENLVIISYQIFFATFLNVFWISISDHLRNRSKIIKLAFNFQADLDPRLVVVCTSRSICEMRAILTCLNGSVSRLDGSHSFFLASAGVPTALFGRIVCWDLGPPSSSTRSSRFSVLILVARRSNNLLAKKGSRGVRRCRICDGV